MYKAEKMMISLLQQAIKEDIFILLQHDKTSKSIWDALRVKFEGSENMIKSKKALLKKEFDLFTSLPGEDTKKLIERYCHLVRSMSMLSITKDHEEWVDKLADALPQKEWGTYLMILKNTGVYDRLTISQFIEKIESQDLEQQKIARMNSPSGQQDVKMYYKGSVPEVAKDHMALLGSVLLSYEGLVAGRVENPMLTKEDYDQIDAEEMELMDIKWCLASVLRRAEKFKLITGRNDFLDAHVSTLGFDKSEVTCFRCREKGHFKRECKNKEANDAQNPFGKDDYYRKAIYQQVGQQQHQEQQAGHGRKVIEDSKRACLVDFNWNKYISPESKACLNNQDDERLPEGFSWDMFVDEKGEFKAFIAKIVKEPNMFTTWMKSIGETVKSVASDESSQSADESSQSADESSQSDESSEKEVVFDQTPSDSDYSDDNSEQSFEFDQSPIDDSSDDEEERHINVAKTHLSPESFHFYFAERLETLKEK
ncbi:putative transcription factor interactor and regulator CCHC(Zn) family [Helianthus annuus]|nr:putative transcription factor interactor and regulator CCHC(Zn) family [Helianthus annuus]